jgi:hypothetical protein
MPFNVFAQGGADFERSGSNAASARANENV